MRCPPHETNKESNFARGAGSIRPEGESRKEWGTGGRDRIRVQVDPDLEGLIPTYLANRDRDIASIRQALETGDLEATRIIGHSMKGSGGGYGFDEITAIGRAIEVASKDSDPERVRKATAELEDYLGRVDIVFE